MLILNLSKFIYFRKPNSGLGDHNYCRNPDEDSGGVWCYKTDPNDSEDWEYCALTNCAGTYRISKTTSAVINIFRNYTFR